MNTNRSATGGANYCEMDSSFPMADSRGTLKHTNMLMEFCSTNECNVRKTYADPPCTQQNVDRETTITRRHQIQC